MAPLLVHKAVGTNTTMPKKQNGFGNPKSFAFKNVNAKVYKGKGPGAVGSYPSNRQYGTTVQRTVIEQYNLDSDWTRWRKGFEYYNQGAYLQFQSLDTVLYQGTEDEVPVRFVGQRFATKNADSNTHYSIKREILENKNLGLVTEVFNNKDLYGDNYNRHEIWAKVSVSDASVSSPQLLRRCIGERVTDGFTSANIINVMTTDRHPSVYSGKVLPANPARCNVTIPLSSLGGDAPHSMDGQVVYINDLIVERSLTDNDTFTDSEYYFGLTVDSVHGYSRITIRAD